MHPLKMKNIYKLFIFMVIAACGSAEENKTETVQEENTNENK